VELPATRGYIGTVSGDLPHLTKDVLLFTESYPDIRLILHFVSTHLCIVDLAVF